MFYVNELEMCSSAPRLQGRQLGEELRQLQTSFVALMFMAKSLAQLQAVLRTH